MVTSADRQLASQGEATSKWLPAWWWRWAVLAGVVGLGVFIAFWRLGTATWNTDELVYAKAGLSYVHGHFGTNQEHPFLAKELIGLSELVLGAGRVAARVPAALAGLLTGMVIWGFVRRTSGWWTALGALALWLLLPHAVWFVGYQLDVADLDRYGMLDVFCALFIMLALDLGWRWATSGSWRWATAAGAAIGLAAASKAPGLLILPVVVVTGVLGAVVSRHGPGRTARRWSRGATQGIATCLVAGAVAFATYLPAGPGGALGAIRYMWRFQSAQGNAGHPVIIAGTLYRHAPWWAHLYWQTRNYGIPATVVGAVAIMAAVGLGRRPVHFYLLAAAAVPWAYLSFLVGFALPHYYFVYQPPLAALVALGLRELFMRAWNPHRLQGRPALASAGLGGLALLALPFAALAGRVTATVATLRSSDYAAAAQIIRDHPVAGGEPVAVAGYARVEAAYLPGRTVVNAGGLSGPAAAVVVDPLVTRRFAYPGLDAYLASHRSAMTARHLDRLTVYLARQ